jgi:hypothetical protein
MTKHDILLGLGVIVGPFVVILWLYAIGRMICSLWPLANGCH